MQTTALFIVHRTKPGRREDVKKIWLKHMAPAIQENAGHLAYFYTFDNDDPETICAFQQYASEQDARDFLAHPRYVAYLAESRDLLAQAPQIRALTPQWIKSA